MPTYSQTITNPGAETGNTSGWTVDGGEVISSTSHAHSGTRSFRCDGSGTIEQTITVSSARYDAIDHGQVSATFAAWLLTTEVLGVYGSGYLYIEFYSSENYLLGSTTGTETSPTVWTQKTITPYVPPGTRTLVIGVHFEDNRAGTFQTTWWDDFTLDLVDSEVETIAAEERAEQAVVYAVAQQPADYIASQQVAVLTVNAAEESTGEYLMNAHQVVAYALVKGLADRQDLRAWPFVQDDHIFYVLQLGELGTIVYDSLTEQWTQWFSPGFNYYRGNDSASWEGYNICCDTESGILWKIDPTGRLDNGDTLITSKVVSGLPLRMRQNVPCYMAQLTCSQFSPSTDGTSMSMRTSDNEGEDWVSHGTIDAEAVGERTFFRWYGLGNMSSPGRIFEITNAGYARRLNSFTVSLGGVTENGNN